MRVSGSMFPCYSEKAHRIIPLIPLKNAPLAPLILKYFIPDYRRCFMVAPDLAILCDVSVGLVALRRILSMYSIV